MKNIHLICNAHLDPVWLWQWREGAAEAVSTFRIAADFCEEFDSFIFNHNEAILYQWIEDYEPILFDRIKKLVEEGKWHIMGGWYIQPDCNLPCGESFIRQIEKGIKYFEEKFGVRPTTAMNVDPFGHTRGLVQILRKTGYDSYLFMRPDQIEHGDFIWEGFDDCRIIAHRIYKGYNTLMGQSANKITSYFEEYPDGNNGMILWGIGNHGGGPSFIDLKNIEDLISKNKDYNIIHSTPERYFKTIDGKSLKIVSKSLMHSMVGCYTSMIRIKQLHRKLENMLYMCEKMVSHAKISECMEYNELELSKAQEALMFSQFHDILPGSAIKAVEDDSLRYMAYACEILDKQMTKAFFSLAEGQPKAKDGEIPVLVYNPHPYKIKTQVEFEFQLADQNWNEDEFTIGRIYNQQREFLPSQNEQEASSLNLDWRKRVIFDAELEASSMNRFDCKLETLKSYKKIADYEQSEGFIKIENNNMKLLINTQTGLIDKYETDGKDYLKEKSAQLIVMQDSEDPWGMTVKKYPKKVGQFKLLSAKKANEFLGYPTANIPTVRVIENGDVRMVVQAIFAYKSSYAIVEYKVPKNHSFIDISVTTLWNEVNKMIKLSLPTMLTRGEFTGQTAFGTQTLDKKGSEITYQKWCGIGNKDGMLAIINNCIYAGSCVGSEIRLSLLHSNVYSAHPIMERLLVPQDRYMNHIDLGERNFEFRIMAGENDLNEKLDMESLIYNERPQVLSFFPSGLGTPKGQLVKIDNISILISAFKKKGDGYIVRLYNSTNKNQKVTITLPILDIKEKITFGKSEVKTLLIDIKTKTISETDMLGTLLGSRS